MTLHKTLILFLTLLISSCSTSKDTDERIAIYNPEKHKLFIGLLNEKNVKYRIQDDGQIVYSIEQKDAIIKAFEQVMGNKIPDLQPHQNSTGM